MSDDRVKTKVVGHREPHYQGEPRANREIKELVDCPTLKEMHYENQDGKP